MEIKKIAVDAVNEVIVLTVSHMDYKGQVAKRINEKMPLATVKGFRKGAVPKALVEKQYGNAIKIDEVTKVLTLALERYLQSERINLLGTPLPVVKEDFSWNDEELIFEYEIGLAPQFNVDLDAKSDVVKYKIIADDGLLDAQIARIQKQYGTIVSQQEVAEGNEISGIFLNEDAGINNRATLRITDFADANITKSFEGKKIGDVLVLNTKELFKDEHKLSDYLNISYDDARKLEVEVTFTIDEIVAHILGELNQELFDKLFGPGNVNSIAELRVKIQEDAEKHFESQSDQKLLADVQDFLIENNKFELPKEFLIKWLQTNGEKKLSPIEALAEYNRSEKGLRFQLIESKALAQSNIQVNFEDLKSFTFTSIRQQMAQFGQTNPTDQEVEGIVARVLSNQEEVKRLSQQVVADKMLKLFLEKANPSVKEVTYEQFVATTYTE